jgi:lipopolysaccharide assembly outer membrane protein LptD (OstA)
MKRARAFSSFLFFGTLLLAGAPTYAQVGSFSGFDSIHTGSIESNARTGDFTIPSRFTASRNGVEVSGDRANGNASTELVTVEGHVVVHITRSVSLVGEKSGAAKGPSTLTCDHLEVDALNHHYHATGNVHYVQGARALSGDRADLDDETNQMRLEGNVSIAGAGQSGLAGGFDSLKTNTINANSGAGDFTIPGRFQAVRQGVEISGDRARGNTNRNETTVLGHVVVKIAKRSGILTCDRLEIDGTHRLYHAVGNVQYMEPSRELVADTAEMNEATHMLHLVGNVRVTDTSRTNK